MKPSILHIARPGPSAPPNPSQIGGADRPSALALPLSLSQRKAAIEVMAAFAVAGLVVFAAYHAYQYRTVGSDDAFITYRHADNLRRWRGMSYNAGERVEGTSTFLFTILLALIMACGGAAEPWSRILGGASFCGLVVVTYLLVRKVISDSGSAFLALGAAALVAASTPLAYWGASGMETLLFALLVMIAVSLEILQKPSWPVFAGFAALTRPEGVAFAGMLILMQWAEGLTRRTLRPATRAALRSTAKFLAVFGPVVVFRLLYFGELMPNSVIAKSGFLEAHKGYSVREWWRFLWNNPGTDIVFGYLGQWSVGGALAIVAILLWRDRFGTTARLASTIGLAFLICVWDEGDWMGWYRLLVPTVAPFAVLVVLGLRAVLFQVSQRRWGLHAPSYVLVLGAVLALLDKVCSLRAYSNALAGNDYMKTIGRGLRKVGRPEDTLATDVIGVVGFYSRMRVIDMMGLCNKYIARHGKRFGSFGKVDDEYVAGQRPTFYMFHNVNSLRSYYDSVNAFAPQRRDYVVVMTPFATRTHDPAERILAVRKDRPGLDQVESVFEAELMELDQFLQQW